jgi:phospholipid-binding lipoprotein MlaA
MRLLWFSLLLFAFSLGGCAHDPAVAPRADALGIAPTVVSSIDPGSADPGQKPSPPSVMPDDPEIEDEYDEDDTEGVESREKEEGATIADPLEPFNRAMFHFNDKLYFWVLKPVAQAYQTVVPEEARLGVKNFFTNLAFPVRFVNSLLQAEFVGAATEVGRFILNTIWGVGGLFDVASLEGIDLPKREKDLGQTLGVYGVGQGFFINWPILGPSSPRDTVGYVGDFFLSPLTYGDWWYTTGIKAVDKVNDVSFRIGDYEALKEASIDPYVAIRDAYVQYRLGRINKAKSDPPR